MRRCEVAGWVCQADRRNQEGLAWAGGGRHDLPADPFGAKQERRELHGDRPRTSSPAGGSGPDRTVQGEDQLPARARGQWDEASQPRGSWVLGSAEPGWAAVTARVKKAVAANLHTLKQLLDGSAENP